MTFTDSDFEIELLAREAAKAASARRFASNPGGEKSRGADSPGGSDGPSSQQWEGDDPWPEPDKLPASLLPVPAMQEALIPKPFRPWLLDISERMQCPLVFPVVGSIIAIAALVGRLLCIRPKRRDDWSVVPNLWGAVVGRPSIMKTPALAEALRPLHRLEIQALERYEKQLRDFEFTKIVTKAKRGDLENKVRKAIKDGQAPETVRAEISFPDEEEPVPIRFIVNDSTVEKLGIILHHNPRGVLIFRDELTGFLKTLDRDGHEGDRAFYLEAWNGSGSYTYDRVGRGTLHIKAACVSILGGIQPGPLADYLRAAVKGGNGDDGLIQRFQLLVYPDDLSNWRNVDRWPDTQAKKQAFDTFEKLAELNPLKAGAEEGEGIPFLRFTSDAQGLFDEWRNDLERKIRSRNEHPVLEAHLAKYRSLMPSLALLFHLSDVVNGLESKGVSLQAAKIAAGWCDFLEAHARRIYQGVTQRSLIAARTLAKHIQENHLQSPFSTRDVYRHEWSGLTDPDDVKAATEILEDLYWLRSERVPTTGRTKLLFHVNPKINATKKETPQ